MIGEEWDQTQRRNKLLSHAVQYIKGTLKIYISSFDMNTMFYFSQLKEFLDLGVDGYFTDFPLTVRYIAWFRGGRLLYRFPSKR